MKRNDFLKKSLIAGALGAVAPQAFNAASKTQNNSTYDKLIDQVGFNHLPNNEQKTMNTVIHKANTRGHANHGWLDSHHTFSFANYHNPERMHFGVLRVLNDDHVAAGRGFGTHPHDNMEIISIPLEGDLEHKDSMGNEAVIKQGDIQVMSAGTGIYHSEYNKNENRDVKFLQIWVFPNQKNVAPRYDQMPIKDLATDNELSVVLSPNKNEEGVWIHQDAWFSIGEFNEEKSTDYKVKKDGNGVYAFVIEGDVTINGEKLSKRDGMGIWNTEQFNITASKDSKVLLMDVPMRLS